MKDFLRWMSGAHEALLVKAQIFCAACVLRYLFNCFTSDAFLVVDTILLLHPYFGRTTFPFIQFLLYFKVTSFSWPHVNTEDSPLLRSWDVLEFCGVTQLWLFLPKPAR